MESEISNDRVVVRHSEKIGSLLATIDDFLMNVKIGEGVEHSGKAGKKPEIKENT